MKAIRELCYQIGKRLFYHPNGDVVCRPIRWLGYRLMCIGDPGLGG